jgi:hypothetical protein
MTEKAKTAFLWSGFHKLSVNDKALVLKIIQAIPQNAKPDRGQFPVKNPEPGEGKL